MSATPTDPIPVRALNQVTYCPRLYFLQYVDAVMPTTEHVEGGHFDHRRVDAANLKNKTRKDGAPPVPARSPGSPNCSASAMCST